MMKPESSWIIMLPGCTVLITAQLYQAAHQ